MTELIQGRYEPTAVVGMGGQGYVLHAIDRRHDRAVAIKVCTAPTDEGRAALLSEARVLLTLEPHPNLPLAREDFFLGDRYCIVMDWIDGTSLSTLLASSAEGRLPFDVVLDAVGQIAQALDHLHGHEPPVVHQDVKPSNVILRSDGRVTLVDFGLSGRRPMRSTAGTPAYVAPEMSSGQELTPAADVFSLAATTLELLTGAVPGPGERPAWDAVPRAHVDAVRQAIRRGLATDPAARPESAGTFAAMLHRPAGANLPAPTSAFIGRESDLAQIADALSTSRALSLVGVGGVGKTRLALESARRAADSFDDIVFVELASVSESRSVIPAIARAAGIREQASRDPIDRLRDRLSAERQLLVLDNCEHLVDACARVVDVLTSECPRLVVLATSREPLRVPGEVVRRVAPLPVPTDARETATNDAVLLFCERARAASTSFDPTNATLDGVSAICRAVDGIPLAVELAAALVGERSVDGIIEGLDRQLSTLVRGNRTEPRQETMRAALSWSYDLLSPDERSLLAKLSVFAGPFSLDAAEAVADAPVDMLLGSLVNRSLCELRDGDAGAPARYRMLEPVRQFASEQLGADTRASVRSRHARWHLGLAEREHMRFRGHDQTEALNGIDAVYDDLRAAISYAGTEDAVRLVTALGPFWRTRGYWSEGRQLIERSLSELQPGRSSSAAELELAAIARMQGDLSASRAHAERALEVARGSNDRASALRAEAMIARLTSDRGDHIGGRDVLARVLGDARLLGDEELEMDVLSDIGAASQYIGELDTARAAYDEALTIARRRGDFRAIAGFLGGRGTIALIEGDVAAGESLFGEARTLGERLRDDDLTATAVSHLAHCAGARGDHESARKLFEESIATFRRLGHQQRLAQTLCELAQAVMQIGDLDAACELLDESRTIAERYGYALIVGECGHKLSLIARARGETEIALAHLAEAIDVCRSHNDGLRLVLLVEHAALLADDVDRPADAALLDAAAAAERVRVGFPRPPGMRTPSVSADDNRLGSFEDAVRLAAELASGPLAAPAS